MSNGMSVPPLPDLDALSLDELKKLVVQLLVILAQRCHLDQKLDDQLLQLVEGESVQVWKRRH